MSKFVFPAALKELRFHLSQTGEASVPLRNFLTTNYLAIKKSQPQLPVLIREAYGVVPTVTARFEKGREVKTSLDGLDGKGIESSLQNLLKG
jgi:NADH dehydrogenase (ubiquinone) 1 alpha subcomplex subunit 2